MSPDVSVEDALPVWPGTGLDPSAGCRAELPKLAPESEIAKAVRAWRQLEGDVASFFTRAGWFSFGDLTLQGVTLEQTTRDLLLDLSSMMRRVFGTALRDGLADPTLSSARLEKYEQVLCAAVREKAQGDLAALREAIDKGSSGATLDKPMSDEAHALVDRAEAACDITTLALTKEFEPRIAKARHREALVTERERAVHELSAATELFSAEVEKMGMNLLGITPPAQPGGLPIFILEKIRVAHAFLEQLRASVDKEVVDTACSALEKKIERYRAVDSVVKSLGALSVEPLPSNTHGLEVRLAAFSGGLKQFAAASSVLTKGEQELFMSAGKEMAGRLERGIAIIKTLDEQIAALLK